MVVKILNSYETWYMEQMNNILENGQRRGDRTGTGVISLPDLEYRHDLRESYPLPSARYFNYTQPITEIIWMMSGSSNIQFLKDNGCPFWNGFAVKGDKVAPTDLNRVDRLKLLSIKRGVPYGVTLQIFANEPVAAIDIELDKQEIPNTQDMVIAKNGDLGPVYGVQWRYWPNQDGTTFDQLTYALETLRKDPDSRRVVVDCWNPSYLPNPKKSPAENVVDGKMALTPCHFAFGFYTWELSSKERYALLPALNQGELSDVVNAPGNPDDNWEKLYARYNVPKYYLDIKFIMRSNDWILGQPANMNMYSAMLMMFAKELNMVPRYVKYTGWDSHIYTNHLEGVAELNRRWNTGDYKYSTVSMNPLTKPLGLFEYRTKGFILSDNYKPGEVIKFPIAI